MCDVYRCTNSSQFLKSCHSETASGGWPTRASNFRDRDAPLVVIFDEWAPRTLNPCSVVAIGALYARRNLYARRKMMGFSKPPVAIA
jgi:hypothetical protein